MQVESVDTGAALLTVAGTVGMIAVVRKGVDFVKSLKNCVHSLVRLNICILNCAAEYSFAIGLNLIIYVAVVINICKI